MIHIRTAEEIELIRESNLLVSKTLAEIAKWIKPGISTNKIDTIAEEYIRDHGGEPGFIHLAISAKVFDTMVFLQLTN